MASVWKELVLWNLGSLRMTHESLERGAEDRDEGTAEGGNEGKAGGGIEGGPEGGTEGDGETTGKRRNSHSGCSEENRKRKQAAKHTKLKAKRAAATDPPLDDAAMSDNSTPK